MYPQYKMVKAVPVHAVELLSGQGWVLLEVLKAQEVVEGYREEADPNSTYSGAAPRRFAVPFVVEAPLFLMGKDEESVVAELRVEKERAESALREEWEKREKADAERRKAQDDLSKAVSRQQEHEDTMRRSREAAETRSETIRKMEADLGKIRRHIGQKTYDEALK